MSNFFNRIKETISFDIAVMMIIISIAIVVLSIAIRSLKMNKAKKELSALELKYNELKSVPLSFKLNKAVALSKVNRSVESDVVSYQKEFDDAQVLLKEYAVVLAEIDDYVYSKKLKKASIAIDSMVNVIDKSEAAIRSLDVKLDAILEQESTQRENINTLKSRFREAKRHFLNHRGDYHQSVEHMEAEIGCIEDMFTVFEEWMFASEFNKASQKQAEITSEIEVLESELEVIPSYYKQLKIILVGALEELEYLASSSKSKGVYLNHLEIDAQLEVMRELISEMLSKVSSGKIANIPKDIDDCEARIVSLKEKMDMEDQAFTAIMDKSAPLFERIKILNQTVQKIKELYERVHTRFGFQKLNENLTSLEEKMDSLNEQRYRLQQVMSEKSVPYSTLTISYEELENDVYSLEKNAKEIMERLENACSDEERAKQQLVKLQLLVNEMRIKIKKNRLPSVSDKFTEDLLKANVCIVEIREVLNITPLQVDLLNAKLEKGIDFVYSLYNAVNNLVGMAVMVENAIVFGNRYRSEYAEVDSELMRAELCFNNGQYTKSLKIAMSIIERLHPGAYEKLMTKGSSFDEAVQA
ncbi:MAG: septation ring formation regulator EzrA [Breznakia sp.]